MSKFKVGDTVRLINPAGWDGKSKGSIYKIAEVGRNAYDLDDGTVVAFMYESDFELAEDRATWHPHHDVIVAWAKGAEIQYRGYGPFPWIDHPTNTAPDWSPAFEYRVKPEPDNTAEIADIERKMRELSESQKELADRLEKLKQ